MEYDHEYYMLQAYKESEKAFAHNEVPVGAIVVWDNKIISRGYNQVEMLQDSTAHAEMIALTAAFNHMGSKYLPEATLYVTLEPCLMCCGALYWSKIGSIVFGASDPKNGFSRRLPECAIDKDKWPFHPKTKLHKGIMEERILNLLKLFFESKRK